MKLSIALELAKQKARSKSASEAWEIKRRQKIRCKSSICKMMHCPDLYTEVQKGRWRSMCGKTNEHVSNMFACNMECQKQWVNPESKT